MVREAAPHYPELIDLPDQLVGERVMLRPYRAGDGAAFFAAVDRHREDLARWVGWVDNYQTPDDAEAYVRRMHSKWIARSALIVGIWSKDGREYFGGTGFHGFDWKVPAFELGYFLHQDARGHGYGVDAVRVVVDFAFRWLAARRIWASCDALNAPSIRLLERCGFRHEAMLRNECVDHHGTLRDTLLYAITEATNPRPEAESI
jgi:RimJ/RimL family protein N-acetyltransferase